MTAIRTNYDGMSNSCLYHAAESIYLEFATETRIKFPLFPRPNLIFYIPYVKSRQGSLTHYTKAYTNYV